tara:strand:+ start:329 stop:448 length:120 start_codon:yes stop_codon:yes gene_type:complete
MKLSTLFAIAGIILCVLIVGAIEDPCTTEGLAPGCMEVR